MLTMGGVIAGAVAMGVGGFTYITKIEPGWVEVVPVDLPLRRLDPAFAGFRLAQISDLHFGETVSSEVMAEVCQVALDWKPDITVITGDFIDKHWKMSLYMDQLSVSLRKLAEGVRTVAILGNHDYRMGAVRIRQMLKAIGIQELDNDFVSFKRGNAQLHIAGVDDPWWGKPQLRSVVNALPQDGAAILLAHEPDYADISAATGRFDLQLSGHSHGGQVVFPFIGPPILPHLGRKYPSGLYKVGDMLQYTNRGIGMVQPHIRLNCRPEMTLFTFQPGQKDNAQMNF